MNDTVHRKNMYYKSSGTRLCLVNRYFSTIFERTFYSNLLSVVSSMISFDQYLVFWEHVHL